MILFLFQLRFIQSLPECWILEEASRTHFAVMPNQTESGQGAEDWTL